jgi:hypothetical protein
MFDVLERDSFFGLVVCAKYHYHVKFMLSEYLHGIIYHCSIQKAPMSLRDSQRRSSCIGTYNDCAAKECLVSSTLRTQRRGTRPLQPPYYKVEYVSSFCFQVLSRSPLPSGLRSYCATIWGSSCWRTSGEQVPNRLSCYLFTVCTCVRHLWIELVSWLRLLKYSISMNVGSCVATSDTQALQKWY